MPFFLHLLEALLHCKIKLFYIQDNSGIRETAYKTIVRPQPEYASTTWSLYTKRHIRGLRWCRGGRSVGHIIPTVTAMQLDLGFRSLEQRRVDASVIMLYKIIHGIVAISPPVYFEQLSRQTRHSHPSPSARYTQLLIIINIHFSPCLLFTGIECQLKLSCCLHLISLVWQFGLWTTACHSTTTQLFLTCF